MSAKIEKLLGKVAGFEKLAQESLIAEGKKKEKKLDPKAKVRNRGTVVVPAEKAKDKKDHFPINDADQARNALARVNQLKKAPEWWSGSLQSLVNAVTRKVHSKYPKIEISEDAKKPGKGGGKKKADFYENLLTKLAQGNALSSKLGVVKTKLAATIGRVTNFKNDLKPGEPWNDATVQNAIDQLNNAMGALDQAIRDVGKPNSNPGANYFISEVKKYYGYAKGIIKPNPGLWDAELDALLADLSEQPAEQTAAQPAAQSTAKKPAVQKKHYPKINPEVQKALNYLGYIGKDFKQLNPDGSRGPNTEFALLSFRDSVKWKNLLNMQPNATWEELANLVMMAKDMKEKGQDKEAPTDFTKGPTWGTNPPDMKLK